MANPCIFPDGLSYWLMFHRLPGVGPATAQRLLAEMVSPEAVFDNGPELPGYGVGDEACQLVRELVARGKKSRLAKRAERDRAWLAGHQCHVIHWGSDDYPAQLAEIATPPPLLYVRGDPGVLQARQLAMVGSRNATMTGLEDAAWFASALGRAGLVITSGMALGIDSACHEGALAVGASTVAVLATGIDIIYPARHRRLAERIAQTGALVSEFPLGTAAIKDHFPRRNRIISGLSFGVLVVEAALRSGSLITARYAAEQNREVFVIPGSIHNPLSRGGHALLKQGAVLVETIEDVLAELPVGPAMGKECPIAGARRAESPLSALEQQVLEAMGYDTVSVELLLARTGLDVEELSGVLVELELKDRAVTVPGGYRAAGLSPGS
jgi:DNA processing protein